MYRPKIQFRRRPWLAKARRSNNTTPSADLYMWKPSFVWYVTEADWQACFKLLICFATLFPDLASWVDVDPVYPIYYLLSARASACLIAGTGPVCLDFALRSACRMLTYKQKQQKEEYDCFQPFIAIYKSNNWLNISLMNTERESCLMRPISMLSVLLWWFTQSPKETERKWKGAANALKPEKLTDTASFRPIVDHFSPHLTTSKHWPNFETGHK